MIEQGNVDVPENAGYHYRLDNRKDMVEIHVDIEVIRERTEFVHSVDLTENEC